MMARQMIGGQERQSGLTPWRAVSLCGERSNVPRDSAVLYGAGDDEEDLLI